MARQAAGRSTLPAVDQDTSNDDDYDCAYDDGDALSVLSAVDLLEDPMASPSPRLTASLLDGHRISHAHGSGAGSGAGGGSGGGVGGGSSNGRLADAFSERWGAWVRDTSDSSNGTSEQDRDDHRPPTLGGRRARDFDDEALLLSPYDPIAGTPTAAAAAAAAAATAAAEAEAAVSAAATPPLTPAVGDIPLSSCSSTLATNDDDYWTTGGRSISRFNADISPASTAAGWHEDADPSDRDDGGRSLPEQRRSEGSRSCPLASSAADSAGTAPRGGAGGAVGGGAKSRALHTTPSDRHESSLEYPDFDARIEAANASRGKRGGLPDESGSGYPNGRRGGGRAEAQGSYGGGETAELDSGTDSSGMGDSEDVDAGASLRRTEYSVHWSTERSTGTLREIDL